MYVSLFLFLISFSYQYNEYEGIVTNPLKVIISSYSLKVGFEPKLLSFYFIPINLQSIYSFMPTLPKECDNNKKITTKELLRGDSVSRNDVYHCSMYSSNVQFECNLLIPQNLIRDGIKKLLSFALRYEDESYSILHSMKRNGKIKKLQFAFLPSNEIGLDGTMFFGGIPSSIIKKYQTTCKVSPFASGWSCSFNGIKIKNSNKEYMVSKEDVYFESEITRLEVPDSFMDYLKENYFKEYILSEQCKYTGIKKFECRCSVINQLQNLIFIINNIRFEIPINRMFENYGSSCTLGIEVNPDNSKWIFGNTFLNNYLTLFDIDNESITFYSDIQFISNNIILSSSFLKYGYTICIIDCLIGVLLLLFNCLFSSYYYK